MVPPLPRCRTARQACLALAVVLLAAPTLGAGNQARVLAQALAVERALAAGDALAQDSADAIPAQAPLLVWAVALPTALPEGPPSLETTARALSLGSRARPPLAGALPGRAPAAPERPRRHRYCVYRL